MDYKIPKEVKEILNRVEKVGFQIFIVGGAVRDLLMGREVCDWDFTTDAKPEEILKIFPEGFYDNKFGTVGVSVHGSLFMVHGKEKKSMNYDLPASGSERTNNQIFEITTMRKEGKYQDFRHPGEVGWTDKIEEDLARRDFTINALALSANGEIIDPFHGQEDIKNKTVRAVGDPNKRFQEDALRLIRAIRIATQLGFEIEEKTLQAIKENAMLIEQISYERIRDELLKLLASVNPRLPSPDGEANGGQAYIGILKLREAGILQIILPEVEKTFGVAQEGPKHARVYDIGNHSLLVLKETPSQDPLVKLVALLHDIGKPDTIKVAADGNVTFYNHDLVGGRLALQVARRFHLSKKQTDKLYRLVRWHLFTVDERQTDSAIRRFIKNVGLENIDDMIALRIGDRIGGGTQKAVSWRMEKFSDRIHQVLQKPFSMTDLKVNGNDVIETLNIPPGPKVGEILNKLFEEVLESSSKNNREYLLEKIKQLK